MAKITKVEQAVPTIKAKKKVAAYARVSAESERLEHSLSAQVSYYSSMIQNNPEWEYAGVFADNGISGTGIAKRDEFKRMIAEAEKGGIDIILTKSIQRFARNTVDLLETVRHLKDIGVEVRFEKEHINSMSGDGELMLTILASFAQEESRSISENIKWAKRKKAEQGLMTNTSVPYGYRFDDGAGCPVVIPEQAEVVRWIFDAYVNGDHTVYDIAEELNENRIPAQRGNHWQPCTVRRMLRNLCYTGDMILGKYYVENPLTHKKISNKGKMPMYLVEDSHEAVIDREIFDKAQAELDRCGSLGRLANPNITVNQYTGRIICRGCGRPFGRARYRMRGGVRASVWTCKKVGGKCATPGILESELDAICAEQLGTDTFDREIFEREIDHIEVGLDDVITFCFRDGHITTHKFIRRKKSPLQTREKVRDDD